MPGGILPKRELTQCQLSGAEKCQRIASALLKLECNILASGRSDTWTGKRDGWREKVKEQAESGKLGLLYDSVWALDGSINDASQNDTWKAFRRDAVYKLFMGDDKTGVNTQISATHLAMFLFSVEWVIKTTALNAEWNDKLREEWFLGQLDSVTDVVEYSVFMVDIMAFFDKIPGKYYADKDAFASEVENSMRHLRSSAGSLEKSKVDVGISKTVGGGAAILGGMAVLAAPFSWGTSLLAAGLVAGTAGGLTAAGASMADGIIEQKIAKDSEWAFTILKDLHGFSLVLEMLREMNSKIVAAVTFDKEGLIASLLGRETEAVLKGGKEAVKLGMCVYDAAQLVRLASVIRSIRPELAGQLGQLMVTRAWAPSVSLPGRVMGVCLTSDGMPKVLLAAGKTGAVAVRVAGAALSIGFGIWDLMGGIQDIKDGSRVAKQFRETADGMEDILNGVMGVWADKSADDRVPPTCPKGHTLKYLGTNQNNGWACDGRKSQFGCLRGCTDFHQSKGWPRYSCRECDWDFCDRCYASL